MGGIKLIEVIYKGDSDACNREVDIKLPKNVRQIGNCDHFDVKVYVEDYVMTYIKHFGSRSLRYGVLLGNALMGNGNNYIFIKGAVCAKPDIDNEIVFDDQVWTNVYSDIKAYFDDVEIVGWFASMPGMLENDMEVIRKVHLDNFAGNNRVCFIIDRINDEDSFYYYDEGGMKECPGHYIYYEKNADMQSYMVINTEENTLPEDFEQSRKSRINTRVHRIFFEPEVNKKESGDKKNLEAAKGEADSQKLMDFSAFKEKIPVFASSASSFMLLAVLFLTVALMNNTGQLKNLKKAVSNIGDRGNYSDERANIVDVAGRVQTTEKPSETVTEKPKDAEMSSGSETEKPSQTATEKSTGTVTENATQPVSEPVSESETSNNEENKATVEAVTTERETYVIKEGDTLYDISRKVYGKSDHINDIKEVNNIADENRLKIGETILLP